MAVFAASALLLGAGKTSRIFTLYPANREAQAFGPLSAYLTGKSGAGDILLKLPTGEVLRGTFTIGHTFTDFGRSRGIDRPGGAYTNDGDPILHGQPATIDVKGPSGATVHCEVMNDDLSMHGSGACLFSNGAEYRVVY